jgi:hypothetical protein
MGADVLFRLKVEPTAKFAYRRKTVLTLVCLVYLFYMQRYDVPMCSTLCFYICLQG